MTNSIGKIYSEALFELANEQNLAEEVFGELSSLKTIWEENPDLVKFLKTPTINISEKLGAVKAIFEGKVSEISLNFLCIITEKSRAEYLTEIANSYKELWFDVKGIAEITVVTSVKLSDSAREKLIAKLSSKHQKEIILNEEIDEKILGGIVVKYGNSMLDGSVKNKLDGIKNQIKGVIA